MNKNLCRYLCTELESISASLYCPDPFRGGWKIRRLVSNIQPSTASGAGVVVKRYRLVKFFCIEIIGKYDRNHGLR